MLGAAVWREGKEQTTQRFANAIDVMPRNKAPVPVDMATLRSALASIAPELSEGSSNLEGEQLSERIYQMLLSDQMQNVTTKIIQPEGDGAPRDRPQFKPMNPVCDAAEQGDLATLTQLIAMGGNVNSLGENGNSALAFACANGHADCAHQLLRNGATVDLPSEMGNTPLHAACWADSPKCIRILLDAKANVNQCSDVSGATPMHVAIQGNRDEALALLLARGGDRSIKCDGRTPLQLALQLKHTACEKVLRKFEADEAAKAKKLADAKRAEDEKRANAAADALLAELEAEEAGSGGKAGGKKPSKRAAKAARAAAAQQQPQQPQPQPLPPQQPPQQLQPPQRQPRQKKKTAAVQQEQQQAAEEARNQAPKPVPDLTDIDDGAQAALGGGGSEWHEPDDLDEDEPDDLDEDAAMAHALVNGSKACRRGRRRCCAGAGDGSLDVSSGGSVASRLLATMVSSEEGGEAGAKEEEIANEEEGLAMDSGSIRRVAQRCPRCGSRARITPQGRCPACYVDLREYQQGQQAPEGPKLDGRGLVHPPGLWAHPA